MRSARSPNTGGLYLSVDMFPNIPARLLRYLGDDNITGSHVFRVLFRQKGQHEFARVTWGRFSRTIYPKATPETVGHYGLGRVITDPRVRREIGLAS